MRRLCKGNKVDEGFRESHVGEKFNVDTDFGECPFLLPGGVHTWVCLRALLAFWWVSTGEVSMLTGVNRQASGLFLLKRTSPVVLSRKKMQASPIRIPTVDNDTAWDFCFRLWVPAPLDVTLALALPRKAGLGETLCTHRQWEGRCSLAVSSWGWFCCGIL